MSDKPEFKWSDIVPEPSPTNWEIKRLREAISQNIGEARFTDDELRANIDAWNEFFARKGLDNPKVRQVAEEIIYIIRRSVIQGSKKGQFYSSFYPTTNPDTPPLTTSKIMKATEYNGHKIEIFSGDYTANLASPDEWPGCIEDYTSCNLKADDYYSPYLIHYGDPASLGLEYMKMSVFQLAVGKIALEIIELFEKIYEKELPQKQAQPPSNG